MAVGLRFLLFTFIVSYNKNIFGDISKLLTSTNYICQGQIRPRLADRGTRSIYHTEYGRIHFVRFERIDAKANLFRPYPTPYTFSVAVRSRCLGFPIHSSFLYIFLYIADLLVLNMHAICADGRLEAIYTFLHRNILYPCSGIWFYHFDIDFLSTDIT